MARSMLASREGEARSYPQRLLRSNSSPALLKIGPGVGGRGGWRVACLELSSGEDMSICDYEERLNVIFIATGGYSWTKLK